MLLNHAGDSSAEADRRAEADKCTEGTNFEVLNYRVPEEGWSFLVYRSRVSSFDRIRPLRLLV